MIIADLDIEVAGRGGSTYAHLGHNAAGALVLDVDDPAEFRRLIPGRRLSADLPDSFPRELVADLAVQVQSAGHVIARVTADPGGRLRLRPTPAGLVVTARAALAPRPRRAVLIAGMVLGLVVQHRFRHRRKADS